MSRLRGWCGACGGPKWAWEADDQDGFCRLCWMERFAPYEMHLMDIRKTADSPPFFAVGTLPMRNRIGVEDFRLGTIDQWSHRPDEANAPDPAATSTAMPHVPWLERPLPATDGTKHSGIDVRIELYRMERERAPCDPDDLRRTRHQWAAAALRGGTMIDEAAE